MLIITHLCQKCKNCPPKCLSRSAFSKLKVHVLVIFVKFWTRRMRGWDAVNKRAPQRQCLEDETSPMFGHSTLGKILKWKKLHKWPDLFVAARTMTLAAPELKPSISTSSWFSVFSASDWPPIFLEKIKKMSSHCKSTWSWIYGKNECGILKWKFILLDSGPLVDWSWQLQWHSSYPLIFLLGLFNNKGHEKVVTQLLEQGSKLQSSLAN